MSNLLPSNFLTRSPHYRTLLSEGAEFIQYGDTCIVQNYADTEQERKSIEQLSVIDLCALPRIGFKGSSAIQWLTSIDIVIGDKNNAAYKQPNGMLVARLADSEVLLLNNIRSKTSECKIIELKQQQMSPAQVYSVPRYDSSAWFYITGKFAREMFAKICGIDLRAKNFPNNAIAQTSVARMNGIIIRDDVNEIPAFHLLFDSASTQYMWQCLKDAFQEFNGASVGYSSLEP